MDWGVLSTQELKHDVAAGGLLCVNIVALVSVGIGGGTIRRQLSYLVLALG